MSKQVKQFLRSIHLVLLEWQTLIRVQVARYDHRRTLERVRRKAQSGAPLRVLFIDSEVAKWKAQSLYDWMKADPRYEPIIGVSVRDGQTFSRASDAEIDKGIVEAERYFTDKCCKCVRIYDVVTRTFLDLRQFAPDLVFYEQVYYDYGLHHVRHVCKYALTCYIPYYVPNFGDMNQDTRKVSHRFYDYYFTLNEDWSEAYRKANSRLYTSCKYIATGHPMLDQLNSATSVLATGKRTIIYAPHWTVFHPKSGVTIPHSTFLETGREILSYAKCHTEFQWIIKPHPALFRHLVKCGIWSQQEADEYLGEWEKIGHVCMDGNYCPLFLESSAMITDCASFLTEYGATGKPIIRLMCPHEVLRPISFMAKLYATYYEVHTIPEMLAAFTEVLEKGNDYKREERLQEVKKARLANSCAARNILEFFDCCLWGGAEKR